MMVEESAVSQRAPFIIGNNIFNAPHWLIYEDKKD